MVADREVDKVADMVDDHDPSLVLVNWAQTFLTRLACLLKFASLFSSNVHIYLQQEQRRRFDSFISISIFSCVQKSKKGNAQVVPILKQVGGLHTINC